MYIVCKSTEEYNIYCMKVVRSNHFLITYIENCELDVVHKVQKYIPEQKWSDWTVFLSLTSRNISLKTMKISAFWWINGGYFCLEIYENLRIVISVMIQGFL